MEALNSVVTIGLCKACNKRARLEASACKSCAAHGPRWVELSAKVRNNPDFARQVYFHMNEAQRVAFLEMYGDAVAHLRLRSV